MTKLRVSSFKNQEDNSMFNYQRDRFDSVESIASCVCMSASFCSALVRVREPVVTKIVFTIN